MKVSDIKKLNIRTLTQEKRLEIKYCGRPIPDLELRQFVKKGVKKEDVFRRFDRKAYDRVPWLCGCEDSNLLFCFVCLLYGGNHNWTREGVGDLKHLWAKLSNHEKDIKHKNNFINFQLLGATGVSSALRTALAEKVGKHNDRVAKNRYIFSRMIDILKFCAQCNPPIRNHGGGCGNGGFFLELMDYTRKMDAALSSHMEDPHVFDCTSESVRNDLLQCSLEACREHIVKEVKNASFLSIMVEGMIDVSTKTQSLLTLRYELKGRVRERFWGFSEPGDDLAQYILLQLDSILGSDTDKLIAQSYDGVAAIRARDRDMHAKIKRKYKNAHCVQPYAHPLNKLVKDAASNCTNARIFFSIVNDIGSFFSQSAERRAALEHVYLDRNASKPSQMKYGSESEVIRTVSTYKDDILECFENMQVGSPKMYDTKTVTLAAGFVNWLKNDNFLFWLNLFSELMRQVDTLSKLLRTQQNDPEEVSAAVEKFSMAIMKIRIKLPDAIDAKVKNEAPVEGPAPPKRRRRNDDDLNSSAKMVCDAIIYQIKAHFEFKDHLLGARLFQFERLIDYRTDGIPVHELNQFCRAFPMVDKNCFLVELEVLYSRYEITENLLSWLRTLNFITSFGLDLALKEVAKALRILVTIPMPNSENERCSSTLNLIKSQLRNDENKERMTALTMLAVEQSMVREIPDFNERVIDKFKKKLDFTLEL